MGQSIWNENVEKCCFAIAHKAHRKIIKYVGNNAKRKQKKVDGWKKTKINDTQFNGVRKLSGIESSLFYRIQPHQRL